MTINAYPLQWPTGWKRTDFTQRKTGRFSKARDRTGSGGWNSSRAITLAEGLQRLLDQLEYMGIHRDDVVISTNVPVRLDGLPRSGAAEPADPGAAVYWVERGDARRVMAIDIYDRVADNIAALAATLDALRSIERHGGAAILERAFTGFTALPAPGAAQPWWEVLGVSQGATHETIKAAWRRLASTAHPDKGGSHDQMAAINKALAEGMAA